MSMARKALWLVWSRSLSHAVSILSTVFLSFILVFLLQAGSGMDRDVTIRFDPLR